MIKQAVGSFSVVGPPDLSGPSPWTRSRRSTSFETSMNTCTLLLRVGMRRVVSPTGAAISSMVRNAHVRTASETYTDFVYLPYRSSWHCTLFAPCNLTQNIR
jgi:hypothetical protein